METHSIHTVTELADVVRAVLVQARHTRHTRDGAAVIALHGELGVGKTTFMQLLAHELGASDSVTSPTFVLMKKYHTLDTQFSQLVHIDAYRIEAVDEMRPLQFEAECAANGSIIGVEWAEHITSLLPERTIHVDFSLDNDVRTITIHDQHN